MHLFLFALMKIENESEKLFMEELYQEYQPLMIKLAYMTVRDMGAAEDVVQETLLRLIGKIQILTKKNRPVLRAYIVSSIRNTSIDYLRKMKTQNSKSFYNVDKQLENYADDRGEVDTKLIWRDTVQEVKTALNLLPEEDRSVLQMKFFLEMPDREIAQMLGIQQDSVTKKSFGRKTNCGNFSQKGGRTHEQGRF